MLVKSILFILKILTNILIFLIMKNMKDSGSFRIVGEEYKTTSLVDIKILLGLRMKKYIQISSFIFLSIPMMLI